MNNELGPATRNILAIPGSLRQGSFNRRLLEVAATLAGPSVEFTIYAGLGELPHFNEDIEEAAFREGPVRELVQACASAHAVLISTPEYNHSIPGVLKNAIDWLSRPGAGEPLAAKTIAVIGATTGKWGTRLAQAMLRQTLFAVDALVLTAVPIYLPQANQAFHSDGRLIDAGVKEALERILTRLASGPGQS